MPISTRLMQPRAEGEIAFILKKDLLGPVLPMPMSWPQLNA
ncbi:2-hydroxypent-2,4-dienoate hydratase [Nitrincola nitratireducens]|uniref:2-hydroxypent-2,4-dienoate hydratase n=1 Tax=Nitrincola nitratireducens TaxID=1229521 RepID=W9V7D8_9GAMM|nr:2-hydroxypent-2,4-dienoate hydratase [Nitrincola nitratireducens]